MNIRERLGTLEMLNANPNFINKQLYRMLYSEELYVIAYDRLRRNKGAMTAGISGRRGTADGISMDYIRKNIITPLKDKRYQPKPARRVYIPKANGKKRPLGMPDFKDKLVQEGVNIILNCIYDSKINPTFLPTSFGFRKGLGCHHALKRGMETLNYSAWIIKADVKAFFDAIDHHILIKQLRKRIADERFIQLIWKFLRAGYKEKGQLFKPKKGTPQGGNLSPILANIYLHAFDVFIEQLKVSLGTMTVEDPAYTKKRKLLDYHRRSLRKTSKKHDPKYSARVEKVRQLDKITRKMPSQMLLNPSKAVINYVRYADDWVLGLKCSKAMAALIYDKCKTFFQEELALQWNSEKSILSRSTDREFEFLGVDIHFVNQRQVKTTKGITKQGHHTKRRVVPVNFLYYRINTDNIFARLKQKGYVNSHNQPISLTRIINQDVIDIVKIFMSTIRGICNYYRFVHNVQQLNHLYHILFMSMCKTLAHKGKTTKRQIIKKYLVGDALVFKYGINQSKAIVVPKQGGFTRDIRAFLVKSMTDDRDPIAKGYVSDTALWIKIGVCGLCGTKGYTEMHHVAHIKRQGHKYKGFDLVMQNINRKQIPLCRKCHLNVHNGKHDGISINQASEQFYKNLGFKKWQDREQGLTDSINKKTS